MASHHDFICDLTRDAIRHLPVPIVVRLQAAVVPGAMVDPPRAALSPFLQAMFFRPDGQARAAVLELSAEAFEACFQVDLDLLGPAFDPHEPAAQELQRLRARVAALEAQLHPPADPPAGVDAAGSTQ